ncbi:MAG TPA: methylenetetrahydrofolate reductase [NAD(P)H] [Solirubrobacteraceae bacterium]|nr:methylenetetrahydrofolate reductase [NAD(P)H] [Solirubrobacteraceae bacterium]
MRIDRILAEATEPVFSFEFFPPRSDAGERVLGLALESLRQLRPSFVSVTYGAGGSSRERTLELTEWIKRELGIEAMAHLTCVGSSEDELRSVVERMRMAGIENILALRGDPPRSSCAEPARALSADSPHGSCGWAAHPQGLRHSTELARLIRDHAGLCVGGACFPEVHPEAPDLDHDLRFLREKVQSGVSFLITQLFFDNERYFSFVEAARAAGIDVPILPGVMPITDLRQIRTITGMCGATIPAELREALEWRSHDPEAVLQLGVSYATLQCAELLARGAPGIHFYTLNRSHATRAILSALRLLRPWEGRAAARTPGASDAGPAGWASKLGAPDKGAAARTPDQAAALGLPGPAAALVGPDRPAAVAAADQASALVAA